LFFFFTILFGLPLFAEGHDLVAFMAKFYESGALVFGGGHVVLPLLETKFVASGVIDHDTFIAGYGATQAVPGPALHLRELSRCRRPKRTGWNSRCADCNSRDFSARIFTRFGCCAILECIAIEQSLSWRDRRRKRLCRRRARIRPLPTDLDEYRSIFDRRLSLLFFGLLLLMKWNMPSWVIVITLPALMLTFTGLGFAS